MPVLSVFSTSLRQTRYATVLPEIQNQDLVGQLALKEGRSHDILAEELLGLTAYIVFQVCEPRRLSSPTMETG